MKMFTKENVVYKSWLPNGSKFLYIWILKNTSDKKWSYNNLKNESDYESI